ncbi:MAG: hypothetical protein HKO59_15580 [Phycisphaerales bacterium]|nr:hypothetical protein [Phycisphaerae bacterium]NNF41855.1 hypothetical protein [Phycisphaerales bacterium]NNM27376.1 hypothetical protein [Phycisphaerales bacterium]
MNKKLFGCATGVAILTVGALCVPASADDKSPDLNLANGGLTPAPVVHTQNEPAAAEATATTTPTGTNAVAGEGDGPNARGTTPTDGGSAVDCQCGGTWNAGDRVEALVDNPQGGDMLTGDQGTVICGPDPATFPGFILIEWDDYTTGHDGNGFCLCPAGSATPGAGWYVLCEEIGPADGGGGVDCVCDAQYNEGDRVRATVDNPSGQADVFAGDEGTVICGANGTPPILIEWDGLASGHDGNGFCRCPGDVVAADGAGWYVDCTEIEAATGGGVLCTCDPPGYEEGDRVAAAIDNPGGTPDILAGDLGTIICGRFFAPDLLLVEFDDFTTGHDGFGACDCPADGVAASGQGWYVFCDEIEAAADVLCTCDPPGYFEGDRVAAAIDNPGGTPDILEGDQGTVICGRFFAPDLLLVEFDDFTTGHDGFGACDCPADGVAAAGQGWYVFCDEIELATGCVGDVDGDGDVDFVDLLLVLANFGCGG